MRRPLLFLMILWMPSTNFAHVGPKRGIEQSEKVVLEFSLNTKTFTLHEPIVLTFTARSDSHEILHLNLGRDRRENFQLFLTCPDGRRLQLHPLLMSSFSRVGDITLNQGQTYAQQLLLNEWFSFEEVGVYTIEAGLNRRAISGVDRIASDELVFRENFRIKDRDVIVLTSVCDSLATVVEASNSYENALEAALKLSYVNDDIAVPYLRRILLATKLVEPIAIAGLERIADHAAISALSSGLTVHYNNAAALSRAALERIHNHTTDPKLREEILKILERDSSMS